MWPTLCARSHHLDLGRILKRVHASQPGQQRAPTDSAATERLRHIKIMHSALTSSAIAPSGKLGLTVPCKCWKLRCYRSSLRPTTDERMSKWSFRVIIKFNYYIISTQVFWQSNKWRSCFIKNEYGKAASATMTTLIMIEGRHRGRKIDCLSIKLDTTGQTQYFGFWYFTVDELRIPVYQISRSEMIHQPNTRPRQPVIYINKNKM